MTPAQRIAALVQEVLVVTPSEATEFALAIEHAACELGDQEACDRIDARQALQKASVSALEAELFAWPILVPRRDC